MHREADSALNLGKESPLAFFTAETPRTQRYRLVTLSGAKSLGVTPDETEILRCAENDSSLVIDRREGAQTE
jgi:hypothetical protein